MTASLAGNCKDSMTIEEFENKLQDLVANAPGDLSPEVARLLEQACEWLKDGPCERCHLHHEDVSC